jgi:hypothetical protein
LIGLDHEVTLFACGASLTKARLGPVVRAGPRLSRAPTVKRQQSRGRSGQVKVDATQ